VAVSVAHHAEDQAETFLIRLLRGSGTSGLGCMPYRNNRHIIRPLLDISRNKLRRYLAAQKQSWREDASNLDHSFLRNRIRHELLPLLEEYAPAVAHRLAATARLLRQDDELLAKQLDELLPRLVKQQRDGLFIATDTCCRHTEGLRLRLFRHAVQTLAGSLRSFGLDHFLQIDRLLLGGRTGALLPLPQSLLAIKTADGLLISLYSRLSTQQPLEQQLPGPGRYDLGNGMLLLVEMLSGPPESCNHAAHSALVDLDAAPFPWLVRPWRSTDRLILHGGSGSRAAGRILIDLKVPRHLRPGVPLLLKGEQPLWLVGVKRSGHAPVSSRSISVIKLTISGATDAAHPP
jgi:tRNA(Ile)-lysidine synthase